MKKLIILFYIILLIIPIPIVHSITTFSTHRLAKDGEATGPTTLDIVDWDNDGDLDIVYESSNYIVLKLNNGQMGFNDSFNISTIQTDIQDIKTVDIDNDGDMDMFSSSVGYHLGYWNLGSYPLGIYWLFNPSSACGNARGLSIGDIDNDFDSDIDVVGVCPNPPNDEYIMWFENLGDGLNWDNNTVKASDGDNHQWIDTELTDLDEDGDLDIVACSTGATDVSKTVTWFENEGGGITWTERDIQSMDCLDIEVIDLDNDDDLDIVAVGNNNLTWYENNGLETFTPQTIIASLTAGWELETGDFDGDVDVDIAYVSGTTIKWLENLVGDASSFADWEIDTGYGVAQHNLEVIDFDLDGDLDIVASDLNNDRIRWMENDLSDTEVSTCVFPTLFCDNFNYATPMFSRGWLIYELGLLLNNTFTPLNNTLNLSDGKERYPHHETESFPVSYWRDASSRFTEHYAAPVFSSQFDLTFSNISSNLFRYSAFRSTYPAYSIKAEFDINSTSTTPKGNSSGNMNWYYMNETQPSTNWVLLCGNCSMGDELIRVKINSYFQMREDYPFNSSIDDDEVDIYLDGVLIGTIEDYVSSWVDYLSQYEFIAISDSSYLVDNYYVMTGTDRITYTGDLYYRQIYDNETDIALETVLGTGETGDMATALDTIWDDFGLLSTASKLMAGLFLMFLLAIVMFGASLSFHVELRASVLILIELFFMILLTYIKLLPIWLPFVVILLSAGIGALVIKSATG